MITGLLFVQAVVFGILSAIIASNKNRSAGGWGGLGFLFGLFGFIAAIAVGEVEDDTRSSRRRSSQQKSSSSEKKQTPRNKEKESASQTFDPDEHEKKCPMCAEYIKLEARRCKHCGHEFSKQEVERQIEEVKQKVAEKRPPEPKEKKDPSELETPPPDEIAARCGDCHYPLRSGQRRCPKCQKEVVWS